MVRSTETLTKFQFQGVVDVFLTDIFGCMSEMEKLSNEKETAQKA